jgi:hypothetical protein
MPLSTYLTSLISQQTLYLFLYIIFILFFSLSKIIRIIIFSHSNHHLHSHHHSNHHPTQSPPQLQLQQPSQTHTNLNPHSNTTYKPNSTISTQKITKIIPTQTQSNSGALPQAKIDAPPRLRSTQKRVHPRPRLSSTPGRDRHSTPSRDRSKNSSTPSRKWCSQNGY